jgi:hypothetical protein
VDLASAEKTIYTHLIALHWLGQSNLVSTNAVDDPATALDGASTHKAENHTIVSFEVAQTRKAVQSASLFAPWKAIVSTTGKSFTRRVISTITLGRGIRIYHVLMESQLPPQVSTDGNPDRTPCASPKHLVHDLRVVLVIRYHIKERNLVCLTIQFDEQVTNDVCWILMKCQHLHRASRTSPSADKAISPQALWITNFRLFTYLGWSQPSSTVLRSDTLILFY